MNLPVPTNATDAAAAVGVLEFLASGQALLRDTPVYLAQVRAGQSSRRLVRMFYHQTAPKVMRYARRFARVPELAGLREPLLSLAAELDRLRIEARKLL